MFQYSEKNNCINNGLQNLVSSYPKDENSPKQKLTRDQRVLLLQRLARRRAQQAAAWQMTWEPDSTATAWSSLATHVVWHLPTASQEVEEVRQKQRHHQAINERRPSQPDCGTAIQRGGKGNAQLSCNISKVNSIKNILYASWMKEISNSISDHPRFFFSY